MSEQFEGEITGLPDWHFSDDEHLQKYIEKVVVEALSNSLEDAGCLWLDMEPLGVHFYLNLNDGTAEASWKRSLADIVLEEVKNSLPGGPDGHYPIDEDNKAYVAEIVRDLRDIADKVDAFMAAQERSRSSTVENASTAPNPGGK